MKKTDDVEVQNVVFPKMTHLMIWFGGELPEKRRIVYRPRQKLLYQVCRDDKNKLVYVDYVKTLKGECKKMKEKGEACILVYDSKMTNDEGKQKMEDIVKDIPNCYIVDYEAFSAMLKKNLKSEDNGRRITGKDYYKHDAEGNSNEIQSWMIEHIDKLIRHNIDDPTFNVNSNVINGMGNLVDCVRMLLLLHPSKLKQFAIDCTANAEKEVLPNPKDFSILYHDFDMIQIEKPIKYVKKIHEDVRSYKDEPLLLCNAMGFACKNIGTENCIIRAISKDDDNEAILQIMLSYKNTTAAAEIERNGKYKNYSNVNMYMATVNHAKCESADFDKLFIDEGHRTWWYKNDVMHNITDEDLKNNNRKAKYVKKNNININNKPAKIMQFKKIGWRIDKYSNNKDERDFIKSNVKYNNGEVSYMKK